MALLSPRGSRVQSSFKENVYSGYSLIPNYAPLMVDYLSMSVSSSLTVIFSLVFERMD